MIRKVELERDIEKLIAITAKQMKEPRTKNYFEKYKDDFFYVLDEDDIKAFVIIQERLICLIAAAEKGKGHGKALLEFAKKHFDKLWLRVRESNVDAIKFYEKNGFKLKDIIKEYYKNKESAVVMDWLR